MIFITKGFFEVAIKNWPESDFKPRPPLYATIDGIELVNDKPLYNTKKKKVSKYLFFEFPIRKVQVAFLHLLNLYFLIIFQNVYFFLCFFIN